MDRTLNAALHAFKEGDERLINVLRGEWFDLPNSPGEDPPLLPGIRGRAGACGMSERDLEVGLDMIEMQPGSFFPVHAHPGNHILLVQSGEGQMEIGGKRYRFEPGDSVLVPAHAPHAVIGPDLGAAAPLVVVFFSEPHKHLASVDRMYRPANA
jgi:quercetin dioxygenase-like cupin family protein